ncbi:MAG: ArsR family transcriptional regulator [Nitrosopumilaceae archaeon]|nr:MAG: Transcriptional regulator [Nitrosopumilales archaeon]
MARGYETVEIKQKLVDLLRNSKTGFSGVEISEKLGINRVTMTKYLNVFAAEGLIRQKNIGNVNLWFIEEGTEQFRFPDDYFKVKNTFLENLVEGSEQQVFRLIRNCNHSNAQTSKIMTDIIIPAVESVQELFRQGKIGKSEEKHLNKIISNSIQILNLTPTETIPEKNAIVLSTDSKNALHAEAASASFHSEGWQVSSLGDMSDAIDVLLDLDLEKLLGKIWKQKTGIMIIVVFSETQEGLKFFSEAVNSVKGKVGKNLYLVLCTKIKTPTAKADLVAENLETALQWSQTIFERSVA